MRSDARQAAPREPGVVGTAHVSGGDVAALLPRLRPGDIVFVDVTDLGLAAAGVLTEAGVAAVVNAGRLVSGPYANLGPGVLAEAGVTWVDDVGADAMTRIRDGIRVRVQDGQVFFAGSGGGRDKPGELLARGRLRGATEKRPTSRPAVRPGSDASATLPTLPTLESAIAGRPALLVGSGRHADLRAVRRFVRERGPVVVALGSAADDLVGLSWVPDVLVVSGGDSDDEPPRPDVVGLARDVVVLGPPSPGVPGEDRAAHVHHVESGASAEDVALALLDRHDASIVVGINLSSDVQAPASRTGSGSWLLDARSLPLLASGRPGPTRVAVLIAAVVSLGAGIALGLGPLDQTTDRAGDSSVSTGDAAAADAALRRAEAADRYAERLVVSSAPRLYAGGLTGRGIEVIAMPGVTSAAVKALVAQVVAAGGSATRSVALRSKLFDAGERSQVDSVGSQLVSELLDPRLDPGASTYTRMGQLLGLATTTTQPGSAVADPVATTIRDTLGSAGLAAFPTGVRLAPLVLVVLPTESSATPVPTAQEAAVLAGLVGGLATTATGVVVAGDTASGENGMLAKLRTEAPTGPVSTVDGVDQPLGRATAVLALEAVLTGAAGSYGESGADGPVPVP